MTVIGVVGVVAGALDRPRTAKARLPPCRERDPIPRAFAAFAARDRAGPRRARARSTPSWSFTRIAPQASLHERLEHRRYVR